MRVETKIDVGGAQRKLAEAVRPFRDLTQPLRKIGLYNERQARGRLNARTRRWHDHTGALAKSIHSDVEPDAVVSGTNLPYARIQQDGGIVLPKNKSERLWIPVPDWLAKQKLWPRDFGKGQLKRALVTDVKIGNTTIAGPIWALVAADAIEMKHDIVRSPSGRVRRKRGALTASKVRGLTRAANRFGKILQSERRRRKRRTS